MQAMRRIQERRLVRHAARIGPLVLILVALSVQGVTAQENEIRSAKVVFTERNDSGIDGAASLWRRSDRTDVEIRTDGALGNHPTHIHQGNCSDLDPNPEIPLTNVQLRTAGLTGMSDTTIDVPLAELLEEEHLILIHRSARDIGTYIACGDIVAGRLSVSEQIATDGDEALPGTGVGPVGETSISTVSGVLAVALAALVAGLSLARSRVPLRARLAAIRPLGRR